MKSFCPLGPALLIAAVASSRAAAQCPMTNPPGWLTAQYNQERTGTLVLSSNGSGITTAILWDITLPATSQAFANEDAQQSNYYGVLHA